jgi:hypothetical protein
LAACRRLALALALPLALAAALSAAALPAGAAQAAGPAASTVTRTAFDHLTTGFELTGQHRDLPCESCHVNAIFKGTPRDCASCHGVGTQVRATAKPATHIMTSNLCDACHTPVAWSPAVNFNHNEVLGSCSSCHNNVQATGKGPTHITTDLECNVCHSTIGWAGAVFSHQNVTTGCASCHDGMGATGPPNNHIPYGGAPCESCHAATNYTTWHDVTGTSAVHAAVVGMACQSCHESAAFLGMVPSTASVAADSRPPAALDKNHPMTGDCGQCHDTNTFNAIASKPLNHIPTSAACGQCHTSSNYALYSVTGTHQGVTDCLSCHAAAVAKTFANISIVSSTDSAATHIPFGSLDCNGSGCHSAGNVNPGGFNLGPANINAPTLNVTGHATVAAQVAACTTCHETAGFQGMDASAASASDMRPLASLDKNHPTSGDCVGCHSTAPTFSSNQTGSAAKPANHIPTNAPCAQCHTTANNYALYSVTGTHQGVTDCLSCHASAVAKTFLNVSIVSSTDSPATHIPFGSLDCNGSGCHSASNVNPGGFNLGPANINVPTLTVTGHSTVAAATPLCGTCHEQAQFQGMDSSTGTASDMRPPVALDAIHPKLGAGDCSSCHSTNPTFASNQTGTAKPTGHIPTTAPCAQCHTTANNYALYSVTGTHQGVTDCLSCHAAAVAKTFLNVSIVSSSDSPATHIPFGSLDCDGSGCHTTGNVNPGGFNLGPANINAPTLNVTGHTTVASAVGTCTTCHETAAFQGMNASAATASDRRPSAALDAIHPPSGECGDCHTTTPTFATDVSTGTKPSNHIPTTATCSQCHTTAGNFALYSVIGTHKGVTDCLSCHASAVAKTFDITIVSSTDSPATHIPFGSLDCNGSGCHTTGNVNPGGFNLGPANINVPTLNVTGHTTVAAAVAACTTCHETAPFQGMNASTATASDRRPTAALDAIHPPSGDCGGCHTTAPVFASDQTGNAKPSNHIPTNAPCAQCHTTAGNFALYSLTGTHQGVTECLSCHASAVAKTFANVSIVSSTDSAATHIPFGSLDCNGSGCHTTGNVNPGGFNLGAANINTPNLNVAGHTTVAAQVSACTTCHETAAFQGMNASTATASDRRPTAALDANHPGSGDCVGCHTTAPTFASDQTGNAKPTNHLPTKVTNCAQCHTTVGNNALYSVTGTHIGVTECLSCHAPAVAKTFANIKIVTSTDSPATHIPFGSLDCNGSGCHTIGNVNPGGFSLGAANINTPTLNVTGHTTVAAQVSACTTCHETAAFQGMIASTASTGSDSRPMAFDKYHPSSGDCSGCHTTSPTFTTHVTGGAKPTNHIPTSAPCGQCHTIAGDFVAYVMGATGHAGITNKCALCHAYGLSFAGVWTTPLVAPPAGPTGHIPSNPPNGTGTYTCEACHSASNFTTFSGTVMKHAVVTAMQCMACHEIGMKWKTNTGVRLWVRDSANHYKGQDCNGSGCHTARDKMALRRAAAAAPGQVAAVARGASASGGAGVLSGTATLGAGAAFDHRRVAATPCVSCHGSGSATGKPAGHIASSNSCQSCHGTVAWLPVTAVDHTQVLGSCVSCHNGLAAKGKSNTHIASSDTCATCHTTNAWTPARFDHSGVAAHTCRTCHDAIHATGLPANHVPTSAQCDTCHGTLAWKPATLDHTTLTRNCTSCHNNNIALGVSPTHMSTTIDCAICHSYPDWTVLHFVHTATNYPGDHKVAPTCTACHSSNTAAIPWPAPAEAGSCAGCHAAAFTAGHHSRTDAGVQYTVSELSNCSGACHVYSDKTPGTIVKAVPGPYHRVSDVAFKH